MTRVSVTDIRQLKQRGEKIVMMTAYDCPTARLVEQGGADVILVGDTLGMVVLGYDSTLPVTMDDMVHHTKAVVRGTEHALVVGDMPFMSYQTGWQDAMRNAARLMQETGCGAVKLEGGVRSAETVQKLVEAGIPVMGHIGLTPQSVNQLGGFKVQGKTPAAAVQLMHDAQALEQAGAFAIVLETIPAPLAGLLTQRLSVPTIGIGAGAGCDGQVQVFHDLLGMFDGFTPKHARRYAEVGEAIREAVKAYARDVRRGDFPTEKESFRMDPAALAELQPDGAARLGRRHALGLDS
ncbi:MAG TPA: 3-methyl-2-oxobutanoate hydroxymethyltransferase [Dehalococcoidia bacterium]|jgi:3-methyl-2-oxobutanoate hydroxymethyltransferase|nr:3-methyl-2-oxobutanoate hydroxymethyltransferase [Dehalococcoidia bacterium]